MSEFNDIDQCFVCGKGNPKGLQLDFSLNEETKTAESTLAFPAHYNGWENVVHGGIVATVMDEVMVKSAHLNGHKVVTAEIKVQFKKPAYVETPYRLIGEIIEVKRKIVLTKGTIMDSKNNIVALGFGKLFIVE